MKAKSLISKFAGDSKNISDAPSEIIMQSAGNVQLLLLTVHFILFWIALSLPHAWLRVVNQTRQAVGKRTPLRHARGPWPEYPCARP
jgi:hypothetical protein